jgi:hypothetical protein
MLSHKGLRDQNDLIRIELAYELVAEYYFSERGSVDSKTIRGRYRAILQHIALFCCLIKSR